MSGIELARNERGRFSTEHIERMVHTFYASVRADEELGPIFDRRIDDWPRHLDRMVAFWRAVLRSEPTFGVSERGSPPILHRRIGELELRHFDRWLDLFGRTVDQVYDPDEAAYVKRAAQRIARSLSAHLRSGVT